MEFFDLANNPLFIRYVRSRLRRAAVLPALVIIVFLSTCIIFYQVDINNNNPAGGLVESSSGSSLFFLMQGMLLTLMGGSQVASAVAQMKSSGMIDFHRITPIPPFVQTVGIMLGAPIRELTLYAATLPFALFLALDGPVGIVDFAKLLVVQMGGALMYYSLAVITGLSGGNTRGASGRFIGLIAGLNMAAFTLVSAGIGGPAMLTSVPVYHEVFIEKEQALANQKQVAQGAAFKQPPPKQQITFFAAEVPVFIQSLLFQSSILAFLFIAAARRIHSARIPLYRKSTALLFLSTLSILTAGSLWDTPTFILGLGSTYFMTVCAIALISCVTGTRNDVVQGMQRAQKALGRVSLWSELAPNTASVWWMTLVTAAGVAAALLLAPQPPVPALMQFGNAISPWPSLLVGALTILTFGFSLQYFNLSYGKRAFAPIVLFMFFWWVAPMILGMITVILEIEKGIYLLALSPIAGIFIAAAPHFPGIDELAITIASVAPPALLSVMFFVLLLNQESQLRGSVVVEHDRKRQRRSDHDFNDLPAHS